MPKVKVIIPKCVQRTVLGALGLMQDIGYMYKGSLRAVVLGEGGLRISLIIPMQWYWVRLTDG